MLGKVGLQKSTLTVLLGMSVKKMCQSKKKKSCIHNYLILCKGINNLKTDQCLFLINVYFSFLIFMTWN